MCRRPKHGRDSLNRLLLWCLLLYGDSKFRDVILRGLFIIRKILIHRSPIVESKILKKFAALVLMVRPPHVMWVEV
jgi:hypothetical protein